MKKSLAALAATAILLPVSLSGCAMPSSAAEVDGTRIPMALVESTCHDLKTIVPDMESGCEQVVTSWFVRGAIAEKAAREEGKEITAEELAAVRDSDPEFAQMESNPKLRDFILSLEKWQAMDKRTRAEVETKNPVPVKLLTYSSTLDTLVNPRLGVWDTKKLAVSTNVGSIGEPYLVPQK